VTVLLQRDRNLWAWQNCGCGSGEPVPFRRLRDLPPGGGLFCIFIARSALAPRAQALAIVKI